MKFLQWLTSKKDADADAGYFLEVPVAQNEVWILLLTDGQVYTFPQFTFGAFAKQALTRDQYSKYVRFQMQGRTHNKLSARDIDDIESIFEILINRLERHLVGNLVRSNLTIFYGEDALRAVRAIVGSHVHLDGQLHWQEIPFSASAAGTLLSRRQGDAESKSVPLTFLPNSSIRSFVHDHRVSVVTLDNGRFDLGRGAFLGTEESISSLPDASAQNLFWFPFIEAHVESSTVPTRLDWGVLSNRIAGRCNQKRAAFSGPAPVVDAKPNSLEQKKQIIELLKWSYRAGVFCHAYTLVGLALTDIEPD